LRLKFYLFLFAALCIAGKAYSTEYYWVGGSGDWKDTKHWAISDGGKSIGQIPNELDYVFFTRQSFLSEKNNFLQIAEGIVCGSMDFSGLMNNLAILGNTNSSITINGSLYLTKKVNFQSVSIIAFNSFDFDNEIDFKNSIVPSNIIFTGSGKWKLLSNISVPPGKSSTLQNGELNYNGFRIENLDDRPDNESNRGGCGLDIITTITPTNCNYTLDGAVSVVVSGGSGSYSYSWFGPNGFSSNGTTTANISISGRDNGSYILVITDNNNGGVLCIYTIVIPEPGPLTLAQLFPFPLSAPPTCFGLCNGKALPAIGGGNGGYTYLWSSGEITPNATMLCDPFDLQVTDSKGCVLDTTYHYLNSPSPIKFNGTVETDISCNGQTTGAINLQINGGTPGYTQTWTSTSPPGFLSLTEDVTGLAVNTYNVLVRDANNCPRDTNFIITQAPPIAIPFNKTNNLCAGGNSGAINVNVSGGNPLPTYLYSWNFNGSFFSNNEDLTGLFSGVYALTVTDGNGCTKTISINITEPASVSISAIVTNILCFAGSNGSIDLTLTGGVNPINSSWTGVNYLGNNYNASTQDITNLKAGEYTVTILDGNGCSKDSIFQIIQPNELLIADTLLNVSCFGLDDGFIDLTITGGMPGYSFVWDGPGVFTSNNQDIANLSQGNYSVIVTDTNGCVKNATYSITEPTQINILQTIQNINCSGDSTGSIEVSVSGGTPFLTSPFYTFNWTNVIDPILQNQINLSSGNYTLTATDQNNCSVTESYTITQNAPIVLNFSVAGNTCSYDSSGSINLTPSGGQAPYNYTWTPNIVGFNNQDIFNLGNGTYTVEVTDNFGCLANGSAVITSNLSIIADATVENINCNGGANGSISLVISGGDPNYAVSWTKIGGGYSATGASILNLTAGFYIYSITDASSCILIDTLLVTEPLPLLVDATVNAPFCNNVNDGSIILQINQGTSPYSILWTAGITSNNDTINNLSSGNYSVLVSDSVGCQISNTYLLLNTEEIVINESIVNIQCNGSESGGINLAITGGISPYSILWNGPSITPLNETLEDIFNLAAGIYQVSVIDSAGCSLNEQYTIDEALPIQLSYTKNDINCFDAATGFIDLTITGGTSPYDFEWLASIILNNNEDQAGLVAGFYTITVTDEDLCSIDTTIELTQNIPITIAANINNAQCSGINTGTIDISAGGGISGYNFEWTGPSINAGNFQNEDLTNLAAGNYSLSITDGIGCIKDTSFFVGQEEPITATFDLTNIACNGLNTGEIDADINSTNTINLISWSNDSGFISNAEDLAGLAAGNYYLFASDNVGCSFSDTILLTQPNRIILNRSIINIDCNGNSNASISTNIAGGSPSYIFTWSGGNITVANQNDENLFGLIAGAYILNILDSNNCSFDTTITITQPNILGVNLAVSNILCAGETADIIGNVFGGTQPYTIKWTDESNNTISSTIPIENLPAGNYSLTLLDSNFCSVDTVISILQPDSLNISYDITNSNCLLSNGEIIANILGGVTPYQYIWKNNNGDTLSTINTLSNIPAGNYSFSLLDSNNCTFNQLVAMSDTGATITAVPTNLTCYEISTGAIDISIVGGTSPFTYFWVGNSINSTGSNLETLDDIAELLSGEYAVTITDSNGCVFSNVTNLQQPDSISITAIVKNVSCFGLGDASVDIEISGGTTDYIAEWVALNGNTFLVSGNEQDISGLVPDTYSVSVTDINNCVNSRSFTITQNAPLQVSASINNISCNNANDGNINITPNGGTPPYQFTWSGTITSTNQNLNNLEGGEYNLTVTDSNGCSLDTLLIISNPEPITVSTTTINSACLQSNGEATATAIGGIAIIDYSYTWINTDSVVIGNSQILNNVSAGIYQIIVTDDNNCFGTAVVAISDTSGSIDGIITPVNCIDSASGEIDISVNGGTAPITYLWTNPLDSISSSEDLINLTAGTYAVEITDSIGCIFTEVFNLNVPLPINASATVTDLTCFGDESGAIDITITGGLEPFEIRWNNSLLPVGQQDLNNLDAGTYNLEIVDDLGCIYIDTYEVLENPLLFTSLNIIQPSCTFDTLGSVNGTFQGGVGNYTINWSGPNGFVSSQINIDSLTQGTYCLNITDSLGCNYDTCITIQSVSSITLIIDTVIDPLCDGSADGSIDISVSGTTGEVTYTWLIGSDTIADTEDISNQQAGFYTLVVADESGCNKTLNVELTSNGAISILENVTNALCYGSETGAINLSITGGVPSYNFTWTSNGIEIAGDSALENITSGEFIVEITDANNCQVSDTIVVSELSQFDISEVTISDAQCSNDSTGSVSVNTSGGTQTFIYNWIGNNFSSTEQSITNVLPGEYTITITDINNCIADSTIDIGYLFEISANAGLDTSICPENLPLLLIGSGINTTEGSWYNLNGILLSNDSTLNYNNDSPDTLVYIASSGSCSAADTVIVTTYPFAIADAGEDQTIFGDQEFTLGGNPSGVSAVSYLWLPVLDGALDSTTSNPTATIEESTLFTLTIIDENGCSTTDTAFITRIPTIVFFNGITPNGDGKNDDWTIANIDLFPNNQVEIYNRWGDLLLQQAPYNNSIPWTGLYKNEELPVGTYYYIINLNDPQFPDVFTGPITILR
jgi:gliding motility-associated-like protein